MQVLAIIPARSGSKGLPGKNIKMLAGHPLIAHTIMAASASRSITRTVLSTDGTSIAEIGRKYGAETPFLRPASLSGDTVPMNKVVKHCLNTLKRMENYVPDWFILLQPTCPLRTSRHIDESMQLAFDNRPKCVVSVCPVNEHPYLMKTIQNGKLKNAFPVQEYRRRQELPAFYRLNGSIYIHHTPVFLETGNIHADQAIPYIMDAKESIDIDTLDDFLYASWMINRSTNS